jgi:hypothetical protein
MARKLIVPKLPRQTSADTQGLNRRPQTSASTLYLMQLRAQSLKISPEPHRMRLEVDAEATPECPETVKIKWIS